MIGAVRGHARRSVACLVSLLLVLLWVPAVLAGLPASAATGEVSATPVPVNGSCNGILPPNGTGNTDKKLIGGTLQPGGTAIFEITYPIDPADVGKTFTVLDCPVLGSDPSNSQVYQFSFVPNNTSFTVEFQLVIPANTPVGTSYCNYAKTTGSPSDPQKSFRKAGPACFTVGGNLRIEKHATGDTKDLLAGAQFAVSCPTPAPTTPITESPVIITGLTDSGSSVPATYDATTNEWTASGTADPGFIGISGPSGTVCTVTEKSPPPGYVLPSTTSQQYTIPVGTSQVVEEWFNAPKAQAILAVAKTANPVSGSVVQAGERIDYTVTVTNSEPAAADAQTVTDTLPADVTVIASSISPAAQTVDATHIVWVIDVPAATAAGPGTVVLTYSVTVNADASPGTTLTNLVTIGDQHSATQHHVATGGLTLVKHVDKTTAQYGDTLTYTFEAMTTGDLNQTNVVVTDVVPDGTTYVAGSAGCTDPGACIATYSSATNTVTWQLGAIAAGDAARQLTFQVTIDKPAAFDPTVGLPAETILNSGIIVSPVTQSTPSNVVETQVAAVPGVMSVKPPTTPPTAAVGGVPGVTLAKPPVTSAAAPVTAVLGLTFAKPPVTLPVTPPTTPAASPSTLPFTGLPLPLNATLFAALILIGAGLALTATRRRRS